MKYHISIVVAIIIWVQCTTSLFAQTPLQTEYINRYSNLAIDQMIRYNVPASITMAQGLLESAAGTSYLALSANNHFGIKCGSQWTGPYILKDDDYKNEQFRVYDSPEQSYEDHSLFLRNNKRYARLFQLKITDYKGWAHGLKDAGYATSPTYAHNLIQLIENFELYKLDYYSVSNRHHAPVTVSEEAMLHPVQMCNGNFYTIARDGDTFKSLSKEMGVSERKLRKYNEVDKHYKLMSGDIVYFEKKHKRAAKQYKGVYHRVEPNESIHQISQQYGVRVKTLYKLNNLPYSYIPKVDDLIKIR